MKGYSFSLRIVFVVFFLLFALNVHIASAAVTGSLTTLTFPGASATNCGTSAVAVGGSVTSTELETDIGTLTDGNGTVIGSFSSTWVGTFTATYIDFAIIPAKNPIRMVEVLGGVTVVDLTADNPCLPPSNVEPEPESLPAVFEGPPIPEGFVLSSIVCDVAVYDMPGGIPVGSNMIWSNQTWYVNPTPVSAPNGEAWTEIFVSGDVNGYVPTRCVR